MHDSGENRDRSAHAEFKERYRHGGRILNDERDGGGFIKTRQREQRAAADVFIGGALLVYTPEQRMWYEATQLNDLVFFDLPAELPDKVASEPGFMRVTAPLALIRGVERPAAARPNAAM
jgi:hypothetical protein